MVTTSPKGHANGRTRHYTQPESLSAVFVLRWKDTDVCRRLRPTPIALLCHLLGPVDRHLLPVRDVDHQRHLARDGSKKQRVLVEERKTLAVSVPCTRPNGRGRGRHRGVWARENEVMVGRADLNSKARRVEFRRK